MSQTTSRHHDIARKILGVIATPLTAQIAELNLSRIVEVLEQSQSSEQSPSFEEIKQAIRRLNVNLLTTQQEKDYATICEAAIRSAKMIITHPRLWPCDHITHPAGSPKGTNWWFQDKNGGSYLADTWHSCPYCHALNPTHA